MGRGSIRGGLMVSDARGVRLAKVFDSSVNGAAFWATVLGDGVSAARLRELAAFCPCRLREHPDERLTLLDYLLRRDGHKNAPSVADTLALVLRYLAASPPRKDARDVVAGFRRAAYAGALPDGTSWQNPTQVTWAAYQRHELLSVALQTLFWVVLEEMSLKPSGLRLQSTVETASWFVGHLGPKLPATWHTMTVAEFIAGSTKNLPAVDSITDAAHEQVVADAMLEEEDSAPAVVKTLELIAKLVGRLAGTEAPYGSFKRDPQYFRFYALNLYALRRYALDVWPQLTVVRWLGWLVQHWSVGVHLRVALRKLRDEQVDTFRVKPTDDGLVMVGQAPPAWSNPRLVQVMRALRDLGLVDPEYQLLPGGRALMEELHVH